MTMAVHLDTSALRFYQDAPDNYCHFVLGNLFEAFVGLHEGQLVDADLDLTHNNPLPKFGEQYTVFTAEPRQLAEPPAGARVLALTSSVNWTTLEPHRDFGRHLREFQRLVWERLNLQPKAPAKQVTLIRRNRVASNRYVINEPQLMELLRTECERRGLAFQVVDFEGMSFVSQVELMSRTSVLIGIHGAGLVNSMFLPPDAAVIELVPHRKFEALFFRWTGVSKGNLWIRVMEPSWSVPSLYNLLLACTRRGHTKTNRFYRDRNAVYDPETIQRALAHALGEGGATHQGLEVDVRLDGAERSVWRKLALLRTHRKFWLGLGLAGLAVIAIPVPVVGGLIALLVAAAAFFV